MLKIAFFVEIMMEDFDGVSITTHQIVKNLPRDEVDAIFITPFPPSGDIGYPVYQCPYGEIPISNKGYRFAKPNKMPELEGILNDFDPDIIHFSSPSALAKWAGRYAEKHDVKLAAIYHTHFQSYAPYYFWFLPNSYRVLNPLAHWALGTYLKTDLILAPSHPIKEYLIRDHQFKPDRIKIWGRGVDAEKFSPEHRVENYWPELPPDSTKLLFVSRLVNEKEVSTLMRVYKLLDERRPDIRMIIIGEGPAEKRMKKRMPNALFVGKQKGNKLAMAYASADLFIFPSVTETFGNVVLEALASGLPVVAAAEGGPKDIIQEGETGVLVTPKQEEEFYTEIVKLVDNEDYYKQVRQNAITYARAQKWDVLVDQFLNHYYKLAGMSRDQLKKSIS